MTPRGNMQSFSHPARAVSGRPARPYPGSHDEGFKLPSPTPPPFDPNTYVNQHYTQQSWQKRFADAAGHVYARYRKGADPLGDKWPALAGRARGVNVAKTMTGDWTYTIFHKWWQPSNELEHMLSEIEGYLAPVFDQAVDPNIACTPQLAGELCDAVGLAACRMPWVMARGHRRGKELVQEVALIHKYPDKATFLSNIASRFGDVFSDADYDGFYQQPQVDLQGAAELMAAMSPQDPRLPQQIALFGAVEVAQAIAGLNLILLHAPAPTHFILGDTPLPDTGLRQGFTVPLSKAVALLALPPLPGQTSGICRRHADASDVAAINQEQWDRSLDVVIGPDKLTLDAL